MQRLAVQGAEIKETDITVCGAQKKISNEEWSAVDLKDDKCLRPTSKLKEGSASKKSKGASSVLAFVSPGKYGKLKEDKDGSDSDRKYTKSKDQNASVVRNELMCSTENPFWNAGLSEREKESKAIFLMESLPETEISSEKGKRKPALDSKENVKPMKKTWGFDGFKKWKKANVEDEKTPLSLTEKSDAGSVGKEPETKKSKKKSSDVVLDKVQL